MFDARSAFEFIRQKEGRAFPKEYVLSLLKKGDISKLSIPEDLGDDEELHFIYKLLYAPNTFTEEDFHVKGTLNLRGYISLRELPQGLFVDRNLNLEACTSLRKFPQGFSVGGYLWLRGCTFLGKLPKGLSVGESLCLNGCSSLKRLPEMLSVGWNLYFNQTDSIPQRFDKNKDAIRKYIEQELGGEVKGEILIDEE